MLAPRYPSTPASRVCPTPGCIPGAPGTRVRPGDGNTRVPGTAAITTTRSTFEIEDPSRGPGRVDFRSPDEGFGLEGTPQNLRSRGTRPPKKRNLIYGPPLYRRLPDGGSSRWGFSDLMDSVILGVWAAPGARETLPKGGGRSPPPSGMVSRAPGAARTPKMADFRPLKT